MHTVLDEQPPNGSNTEAVQKCNQRPTCWLRLDQRNESFYLEIQDDGRGGSNSEGNGLRGMRGRVEMLGGTLTRSTEPGTTLTITLPMKEVVAKKRRLPELNPRGKKGRTTIRVVRAETAHWNMAVIARHVLPSIE